MASPRVPHVIKRNRSGAGPQAWIILDVETIPVRLDDTRWQHVFRLAHAHLWRLGRGNNPEKHEREDFTDAMAVLDWITSKVHGGERIGIAAYNADFDWTVLAASEYLGNASWVPSRLVYEKGKWSQRWSNRGTITGRKGASLIVLDLMNFYPMSLRDAAPKVGMRKWHMPEFGDTDERWLRHCRNDVEIAYRLLRRWLEFCQDHDLGWFAPTIAGQAFNAYRHRFMTHDIYVHIHKDVVKLERDAYYAGRCEIYWRGKAPRGWYLLLDSSSFYASVMKGNRFPTKQVGHMGPIKVSKLAQLTEDYCAIARVEVETPVPYFPYRADSRTSFPVGRFVTTLCTPEIQYGIGVGAIRACHECVLYEHAPIFDAYVDYFWNLRTIGKAQKDRWLEDTAKRLLTSVYGKFGQRTWLTQVIATDVDRADEIQIAYDARLREWVEYRLVAGRLEKRARLAMGRDTLLAVPAHVTSYGRDRLFQFLSAARLEHVYYVDTDGLICDIKGLNGMAPWLKDDVLGGLRIVKQSNYLYIRAPKWYELGDRFRRAGIKGNAEVAKGDRYTQEKFRSGRWSLMHGSPHAAIMDVVTTAAPYRGLLAPHSIGHRVHPIEIQ